MKANNLSKLSIFIVHVLGARLFTDGVRCLSRWSNRSSFYCWAWEQNIREWEREMKWNYSRIFLIFCAQTIWIHPSIVIHENEVENLKNVTQRVDSSAPRSLLQHWKIFSQTSMEENRKNCLIVFTVKSLGWACLATVWRLSEQLQIIKISIQRQIVKKRELIWAQKLLTEYFSPGETSAPRSRCSTREKKSDQQNTKLFFVQQKLVSKSHFDNFLLSSRYNRPRLSAGLEVAAADRIIVCKIVYVAHYGKLWSFIELGSVQRVRAAVRSFDQRRRHVSRSVFNFLDFSLNWKLSTRAFLSLVCPSSSLVVDEWDKIDGNEKSQFLSILFLSFLVFFFLLSSANPDGSTEAD